jgi:glutamine amidotransferase/cyclase
LPGVGHFGHCLSTLTKGGFLEAVKKHIEAGKPFLSICVGIQALFSGSAEDTTVKGLDLIKAQLQRFSSEDKKVPQIGWNDAVPVTAEGEETDDYLCGLRKGSKYYFVHSYFAPYIPGVMEKEGWRVAVTQYGSERFVSAVFRGNVVATQFHPEKSGAAGLRLIKAFLDGNILQSGSAVSLPPQVSTKGLTKRVIACLDVRTNDAGDLVVTKGDQYDVRPGKGEVRNLGKPVSMAEKYYLQGADEVVFLNITSFRSLPLKDLPMLEILRRTSETVFVPLTVGGGIKDTVDPSTNETVSALDIAKLYFGSGADKVSIGSNAVEEAQAYYANNKQKTGKTSIETISSAYGIQAVVVSVDPKRVYVKSPDASPEVVEKGYTVIKTSKLGPNGEQYAWYQCTIHGGRTMAAMDVAQLVTAVQDLGAGEILLNCIDHDGQNNGFDLELVNLVTSLVQIPVVASSGAGNPSHFTEVFNMEKIGMKSPEAALGAGMFHRGEFTVAQVKDELSSVGFPIRQFEEDI